MTEKPDSVILDVKCLRCQRQMLLTIPLDAVEWDWEVICSDCVPNEPLSPPDP